MVFLICYSCISLLPSDESQIKVLLLLFFQIFVNLVFRAFYSRESYEKSKIVYEASSCFYSIYEA